MMPKLKEMPATIGLPELSVQRKTSKKIAEIASSMRIESVMHIPERVVTTSPGNPARAVC